MSLMGNGYPSFMGPLLDGLDGASSFMGSLDGLDGDPSLMGPPSLWAPLISFICLLADRRGVMCNRVLKGMDEG